MFQRRHRVVIAGLLKKQCVCAWVINEWADMLSQYNENFDRDRFFEACGGGLDG